MTTDKIAYSVTECATKLGVSRPTVYQLIHSDGFPAFRVGGRVLISAAGLERWIEERVNKHEK